MKTSAAAQRFLSVAEVCAKFLDDESLDRRTAELLADAGKCSHAPQGDLEHGRAERADLGQTGEP